MQSQSIGHPCDNSKLNQKIKITFVSVLVGSFVMHFDPNLTDYFHSIRFRVSKNESSIYFLISCVNKPFGTSTKASIEGKETLFLSLSLYLSIS